MTPNMWICLGITSLIVAVVVFIASEPPPRKTRSNYTLPEWSGDEARPWTRPNALPFRTVDEERAPPFEPHADSPSTEPAQDAPSARFDKET